MTRGCCTLTPTRAISFIWSCDMPLMCCRVFTSTRYWIWEIRALAVLVVCLIAYLRRRSRGCSLSQQISASNWFAMDTLSPLLTIMSPREMSMFLQQQSHRLWRKGTGQFAFQGEDLFDA